jgi:hypothetical protein
MFAKGRIRRGESLVTFLAIDQSSVSSAFTEIE